MKELMQVVAVDDVRLELDHGRLNSANGLGERHLVATGAPSLRAQIFKLLLQRTREINADYTMRVLGKSLDKGPG
jgi:hypothetical protein